QLPWPGRITRFLTRSAGESACTRVQQSAIRDTRGGELQFFLTRDGWLGVPTTQAMFFDSAFRQVSRGRWHLLAALAVFACATTEDSREQRAGVMDGGGATSAASQSTSDDVVRSGAGQGDGPEQATSSSKPAPSTPAEMSASEST